MRFIISLKNIRKVIAVRIQYFSSEKHSELTVTEHTNEVYINENLKTDKALNNRPHYVSEDLLEFEKSVNKSVEREKINMKGEIIYGLHPVQLALQCRRRIIYQLYVQHKYKDFSNDSKRKIVELADNLGIPVKEVKKNILEKISKKGVHQGVCLDVSRLHMQDIDENISEENEMIENKMPSIWLILDQIQDPMNFGAVLRSSYYFGLDKVCAVKQSSCKLSPVVSKASSGAMEILPVYSISDLPTFLKKRRDLNWNIIGTASYSESLSASNSSKYLAIHQLIISKPTICILGNEGIGMSKHIYDLCDNIVTIFPETSRHPRIDSLNVSVVCGIILHQLHLLKKSS